jgi:hypothetical protein
VRRVSHWLVGPVGYLRIRDSLRDAIAWITFVAIVRAVTVCTHLILSIGAGESLSLESILHSVHVLAVLTGALGFLVGRVFDEVGYHRASWRK